MKKKQAAFQISKEDAKELQGNKKLIDQVLFRVDRNGKITYSSRPFNNSNT